jgi:hypothetical protein
MLKQIFIASLLMMASVASAKELSAQDIRDRYQVNGDIYTVDGKRIIAGPEVTNYWRPDPETGIIKGDWSSNFGNHNFQLRYHFQVLNDNSVQAIIEEYGSQTPSQNGPEFKELLSKKEFTLNNLEPIIWKIQSEKGKNLVARFYVSLREVSKPISMDSLPVAGTGISVSDNAGFLWAEGVEFSGRYVGVTSHRGTLALSYVPFAGAKEIGEAEGNQILIKVNKEFQIKLKSATAFLPSGVNAKVYAVYVPEKKSRGFSSLHTFASSTEDRLNEVLKK